MSSILEWLERVKQVCSLLQKECKSTGVSDSAKLVHNVCGHKFQASDNKWKEITLDELENIIVEKVLFFSMPENKVDPRPEEALVGFKHNL